MVSLKRFGLVAVVTMGMATGLAQVQSSTAPGSAQKLAADNTAAQAPATNVPQVVDRLIQREKQLVQSMKQYHPMVETYLQSVKPDAELGTVPTGDQYFLARLDLSNGYDERFYTDTDTGDGAGWRSIFGKMNPLAKRKYVNFGIIPVGFTAMIFPDARGLDRQSYYFQLVRREFLGDVRCLVLDVVPKNPKETGRFLGRIWVEDQDYNIVRFNGSFTNPPAGRMYFHMDSWRQNVAGERWLPSVVYTEEAGMSSTGSQKQTEQFKAQTRIWGYDLRQSGRQEEFTQMLVDQPDSEVKDKSDSEQDFSPIMSLRQWQREAEDNVVERLERSGLLAPASPVDKVLQTVVNNLVITNDLNLQQDVRCRVLLTSPLETFTVGHTIVVSRGLIDVLPDEASLAMVLSHELAHIAAGDQLDSKYAFSDRMWFADEDTYHQLRLQRTAQEEQAADARALELLKKSPYADKLASAGLFLRQMKQRSGELPNLLKARLGDSLVQNGAVRMAALMESAPELQMRKVDQIAALPLGGRIKLNPWNDRVELMRTKSVPLQSAREKMPFEIAPSIPHLTRVTDTNSATLKAAAGGN